MPPGTLYVNSRGNDRVLLYNDDQIVPTWQWQAELPLVGQVDADDFAGR